MTPIAAHAPRFHVQPTYFELLRVPGARQLKTWIGMGILASGIAFVSFLRWHIPTLIGTFAILGSCIAIVPLTMKAIYAVLLNWAQNVPSFLRSDQSQLTDWQNCFQEQYDHFSESPVTAHFGIIYAAFALGAFWLGGAFSQLPLSIALVCLVIAAIASFVCGVGLASIFSLSRVVWQLGSCYQVRVSEHSFGVLSTGKMLVKCYALIAIVWCLYTASATFNLRGKWIPLLALAIPAVIFFIGTFIGCQFPLRKRMVEYKRTALLELDDLMDRVTPKQPNEFTEERQRQINFCLSEMKRVRSLPEWPFSLGNLTGVVGASVGAVAPQIIHIFLPVIVPLFVKVKKI